MLPASQPETVTCRWCKHSMPASKVRYWDGRPQCIDEFRCTGRIPRTS